MSLALIIAQIIGSTFTPCGFELDEDTGETRFAPAPNIQTVIIVPDAVAKLVQGYASEGDNLECTIVILKNGNTRMVRGSIEEVWRKLRAAK